MPTATEPLQGLRRHKLMTDELRRALPAIGTTDGQGRAAVAKLKLFAPGSRYTFYVTEFDGVDVLYGYCVSATGAMYDEFSYASLAELASTRNRRLGGIPAIERDCYWTPCTLEEALSDA